jgi:hypothetical protein
MMLTLLKIYLENLQGGIHDTPENRKLSDTTSNLENEYFDNFTFPKQVPLLEYNELEEDE